ncbi:AsmA family protein [Polynucleobacter sp. AM-25C3]|uniref:AsmA family protein n=1 Tax=Polynucleobacter sp. AM-25C3 TaxID=1855569 RepID=UPI001C0BC639|nr:AsmA family protein [Polynucleobacter sp. AM-25C3]MBU3602182.1 AsmA family protein [Polynucleobacter sp. AM-25C3]
MNPKLKVILATLGGIVILLGIGTWYAASKVDPVTLTKLLASSVKTATGRDLKITGPVTLSFFPRISVSAERLSLSNAPWASTPEMLTLKRIELDIKTLPLLSKRIEVDRVKLSGMELFLQKNASGKTNWDMSVEASNTTAAANGGAVDSASASDDLIFMESVSVLDAKIQYQDGISPASNYQIKRLVLVESGDKTAVSLSMSLQEQALELSGKTGSLSRLFKQWDVSPSHFPMDLNLTLNGKSMLIKGEVDKSPKALPEIKVALTSKAFDWPSSSSPTQASQVRGSEKPQPQPQPQVVQQARKPQSNYLFSNEAIPFDVLPQANGQIVLSIDELGLPNRKPIQNLKATVQMSGNAIDVPHLTLQLGQGQADIQFHLSEFTSASPVLSLRGVTKNFTLENLLARIDPHSKVTGGKMKLAFDLKATGKSLHEIAGNSTGKIQLNIDQARMGTNFLNDAGDFVITVLDSMNPLRKKSSETLLECAVAYLPINSGQINIAKTVGAETDRLNAVMAGSINLKTEAVNLTIDPQEKSGLTTGLDLAGLVKVGGTLANPRAGINQAGVVNSAVSIGLGILTGGATILAENARSMTSKGHPCSNALHPWSDIYPGAE